MLTSITIKNYKSIVDLTLELGRFNLFIGENGGGKSNILEALAMIAGAESNRLNNEDLIVRGVRVARPTLTVNAFVGRAQDESPDLSFKFLRAESENQGSERFLLDSGKSGWFIPGSAGSGYREFQRQRKFMEDEEFLDMTPEEQRNIKERIELGEVLQDFGIYSASTLALRGLQVESHREPLGIFGEGLDVAISQLPEKQRAQLLEYAKMVSWLGEIDIDQSGARNIEGYKPSRSRSNLYFIDKFLAKDNQIFSAENANEGILHILFHLVLFLHPETPKLFAIDNLETALNPHLLRNLVKSLAQLAKDPALDRQALVTTHNPAALDGLNLFDDDQRLFVVSRNEEGHTQAQRIRLKPPSPSSEPKLQLKLSELWMRGLLGGIPTHF
jgi:predicted ATPase